VERLWIDVRRLWVTIASPDLPPDGLRILHLSNMHFTGRGAGLQDSISYALIGPELNRKLLAAQREPAYDALAPRSPPSSTRRLWCGWRTH